MLQLVFGVVMISLSGVFVKLVDVDPTASAFYRMFFGGVVLAAITLARREPLWFGARFMWPAALAALWFVGDLWFWHRSILYVGPGLATLLANFQVFLLAVAGFLLYREKPGLRLAAAIPLAFAGLVLLVLPEWLSLGEDYRAGVVFGLVTAVCYAGYTLTLRFSRLGDSSASNFANMAVLSLICAAILAPLTLIGGESLAIPSWKDFGWLLTYGVAGQVFGWVLISHSLPKLNASTVGLILLLQPVSAFILDIVLFDRQLMLIQFAGGAVALVAIYLGSQRKIESRRSKVESAHPS
ncbi:MAG TPA: DMT family transporter [Gammaproteobacteria bacterium]